MTYSPLFILLVCLLIGCQTKTITSLNIDSSTSALEIFAEGIISTGLQERDFAISPNRDVVLYTLGYHDQSRRSIVSVRREQEQWCTPSLLPFSGEYDDLEPFFTPDGMQLFFASNRPLEGETEVGDYNIWQVPINAFNWGKPIALDTLINTDGDEFYPAIGNSGNLYFTATRTDGVGREDIYISTYQNNSFQTPMVLDTAINSTNFEFNAYVNPEETLLIFSSFGRADGNGGGDLYYSQKDASGNWKIAQNMGDIVNSERLDFCPFVDFNMQNFYFTSNRRDTSEQTFTNVADFINATNTTLNGSGNIYRLPLDDVIKSN